MQNNVPISCMLYYDCLNGPIRLIYSRLINSTFAQVKKIIFFVDLDLRLFFIDLHFFMATIQIGVIVQVCYTPQAQLLSNLFTSCQIQCVTYTYMKQAMYELCACSSHATCSHALQVNTDVGSETYKYFATAHREANQVT